MVSELEGAKTHQEVCHCINNQMCSLKQQYSIMSNVVSIMNMATNITQVSSRTYHIEKLNDNFQPWKIIIE